MRKCIVIVIILFLSWLFMGEQGLSAQAENCMKQIKEDPSNIELLLEKK